MNRITALFAACAVFVGASAEPASAAIYDLTYNGSISGTLVLTTSNTLDAVGGYNITGISGTFGGKAITSLFINPTQPTFSQTSTFTYDNVLFPTGLRVLDRYGVAFTTSAGTFNIFDAIADGDTTNTATPYGLIVGSTGALTLGTDSFEAAVPEPSTWAMMILGFLGLGFMAYRRRNHLSLAV